MIIDIKVACRGLRLWFQCPGCDDLHSVGQQWSWDWPDDDDTDRVTISPSLLVTYAFGNGKPRNDPEFAEIEKRCHSFIRDGRWEFLSDSTHALAGQTVDMVPLPEWFVLQDQR